MSAREWKPGDVADVTSAGNVRAFRTDKGWVYVDGSTQGLDADRYGFRPLVVIDPEDREQVERLSSLVEANGGPAFFPRGVNNLAAALREFANPKPRPEEPTRAAALVEDVDGAIWARQCTRGPDKDLARPWLHLVNGRAAGPVEREREWSDVPAVRVLSEGVRDE